jgi:two-component system nitrogen regulation response regulator NtrX
VDVRVIAATNKDLSAEIAAGRFREDLLYRLNVVPIEVPPLRERRGDLRQLVQHFTSELGRRGGLPAREFEEGALERLEAHHWPGNIRELRNAVERLLILAAGPKVAASDVERMALGGAARGPAVGESSLLGARTFEEFKQQAERAFLQAKLAEHDWNVSETARTLQMPRSNLYKKIERYRLSRDPSREDVEERRRGGPSGA